MNRRDKRAVASASRRGDWGTWARAEIGSELLMIESERAKVRAVCLNNIYQVIVRDIGSRGPDFPNMVWLSIKRRDQAPVGVEHFRDFQRIKNELVGAECEAMEIYPAESRLVDTSTQYHLWVVAKEGHRFPFGYGDRLVTDQPIAGAVQRPFDDS